MTVALLTIFGSGHRSWTRRVLVRNVWGQGVATTVSLVGNGGAFQSVPKESPSLPFRRKTEASHGSFHEPDANALNLAFEQCGPSQVPIVSVRAAFVKWHSLEPMTTAMPGCEASPSPIGLLTGFGMVSWKKGPVLAQVNRALSRPHAFGARPAARCAAGQSINFKSEAICESNLRCARDIFRGTAMNYD